jgi:predicted nucleic acid-binding protein
VESGGVDRFITEDKDLLDFEGATVRIVTAAEFLRERPHDADLGYCG